MVGWVCLCFFLFSCFMHAALVLRCIISLDPSMLLWMEKGGWGWNFKAHAQLERGHPTPFCHQNSAQ